MTKFKKGVNLHSGLWIFLSVALFFGLLVSKFLISISVIGFLVWGLIEYLVFKGPSRLRSDAAYFSVIGVFLLLLVGAIWRAEDYGELWLRVRIGLPFLALPLGWACLPLPSEFALRWILRSFVFIMLAFGLGVLGNYILRYEEMQGILASSGAVPVPSGDHIRFSLMLVLGVVASIWLSGKERAWAWRLAALVLAILLHVFSVRSGLLGLYLLAAVFALRHMLVHRRYVLGLSALALVLLLPVAAYQFVPSFRTKIDLTVHNIQLMQAGQVGQYSDTQRLLSYKIAWGIYKEYPILGIGLANLNNEMERIYKESYPEQKPIFPHNQFLTYLTAMGIVGLLAFLLLSLFPFFYRRAYRDPMVLSFFVVLFSSFLTENTLLISIGTVIYVYFLMLFLAIQRINNNKI